MEPIRCYCGFPISNVMDAFLLARKMYMADQTDVDYNSMSPTESASLEPIFTALQLPPKKFCCRTRLTSIIQFHDLEIQDRL